MIINIIIIIVIIVIHPVVLPKPQGNTVTIASMRARFA